MIIDKHIPVKSMRVSEKYCSWINKDYKGLIRERDQLKKEAVKHNSSSLMKSYRKIQNRVNKMNINLKGQCFSAKLFTLKVRWKKPGRKLNNYYIRDLSLQILIE